MLSDADLISISTNFVIDVFDSAVALHAPALTGLHEESDCEMTDDEEILDKQYVESDASTRILEASLGDDWSIYLGKDPTKSAKFDRFQAPPISIEAAVEQLRRAGAARRSSTHRSWAATFKFTCRCAKRPLFERFAHPSVEIGTAVEAMRRAAAAKRASNRRSWVASFKFTGRSGAKPYHGRFSQGGNDLAIRIEAMRLEGAAKRARRNISWAANIPWNKQPSKEPMFERLEASPSNISKAVHLMRQELKFNRAAKNERIENLVLIEDVDDELDEPAASLDDVTPSSGQLKMLMPPPSLEETQESLRLLLAGFEHEMTSAPRGVVNNMCFNAQRTTSTDPQSLGFPQSFNAPEILKPAEPVIFECFSMLCASVVEIDTSCESLEAELLTISERCAQSLNVFEREATLFVATHQAAVDEAAELQRMLIEEEKIQESADIEIERLIAEESEATPSVATAKWVAGSPARAARQMRRSAPTSYRMDASDHLDEKVRESSITRCYAGLGAQMYRLDNPDADSDFLLQPRQSGKSEVDCSVSNTCSAMALDLGLTPAAPPSLLQHKSAIPLSMGRSKMVQPTSSLQPLRPLSVSKSTGSLTKHTLGKFGPDSLAWKLEPMRTPFQKGPSPYSWSTGAYRGSRGGERCGF